MFADLPDLDAASSPRTAPQIVVWQLQFAGAADVASSDVGTAVASALAEHLGGRPHLTRLAPPTFTVAVGSGATAAPTSEGTPNGWQIRLGELVATLDRQFLAVETTNLESWERFSLVIHETLSAFTAGLAGSEHPGEQRLGLRYVDRIAPAPVQDITDWTGWLQPWLLGATTQPQLSDAVVAFAQQVDWEDDDGLRATVRQRAFADVERRGRPAMLLDFDVFREGYRPFDAEDIRVATEHLNDVSGRLFRAAITDRLYEELTQESTVS
jgi:uncharacterized protein (TIGR04255 family)